MKEYCNIEIKLPKLKSNLEQLSVVTVSLLSTICMSINKSFVHSIMQSVEWS